MTVPSTSFAGWEKVADSVSEYSFYVDFERIRKHDGYVYFWVLNNFLKPNEYKNLSSKVYNQGDCKLFRIKGMSFSYHNEPMGGGTGEIGNTPLEKWFYPTPSSIN